MKVKMKMVVASLAIAAIAVGAPAQGAGPKGGAPRGGFQGGPGQGGLGKGGLRMRDMDAEVLAKLNLTPDQSKKIKALKEATQKKMKETMEKAKGGGDREKMRESFRNNFMEYRDGLEEILTPGQLAEYQKQMKEMRAKLGDRRPGKGGPGGPGKGGDKKKKSPPPAA